MESATDTRRAGTERPWQLKMFSVAVKKNQKLKALLNHLRPPARGDLLLLTCGDNNGALNYHLRAAGGNWSFCELEPQNIPEMEDLLEEKVQLGEPSALPYPDAAFDTVVTIDCHEHLDEPIQLDREIRRVLRPGGRAIVTVPNGDPTKFATRLKHRVGMDKQRYGHKVIGYDVPELQEMARAVGLDPVSSSSYSRLFTELVELAINLAYMRLFGRKEARDGQIAPTTRDQLRKVEKSYRVYRLAFPFLWLFSKLDLLVFWGRGYAVVVESTLPGS